jgi:hypothetical protein
MTYKGQTPFVIATLVDSENIIKKLKPFERRISLGGTRKNRKPKSRSTRVRKTSNGRKRKTRVKDSKKI